jgi:hypothetical protein
LSLLAFFSVAALDLGVGFHGFVGTGQATGSLFDDIGSRYKELGASSNSEKGSYSPYYPIVLYGGGIEASFSDTSFALMRGPWAFMAGLDLGLWGGAIYGSTSSGEAFASAESKSLALSLSLGERFSLPLGSGFLSVELAPFVAFNCAYYVDEHLSGVNTSATISPAASDSFFMGAGLGVDYRVRLGSNFISLGLLGDLGFTPLASATGSLGGQMIYPWRLLVRAGYELHFDNGRSLGR